MRKSIEVLSIPKDNEFQRKVGVLSSEDISDQHSLDLPPKLAPRPQQA